MTIFIVFRRLFSDKALKFMAQISPLRSSMEGVWISHRTIEGLHVNFQEIVIELLQK